ncbi:hypothetical protein [Aeoliella sp. SH292]|uniref:hypothetical protein n=1 Tax=Aeoliella sp. SH292 TaxID=3454464 RepID=UPI003F99E16F
MAAPQRPVGILLIMISIQMIQDGIEVRLRLHGAGASGGGSGVTSRWCGERHAGPQRLLCQEVWAQRSFVGAAIARRTSDLVGCSQE